MFSSTPTPNESPIDLPLTIEVSTARIGQSPLSADLHSIALGSFESVDEEDAVELDVALSEHSGLEFDLDEELDSQTSNLDADVEAVSSPPPRSGATT